jgi:hypothetical protein
MTKVKAKDSMTEELADCKNKVQREMILQKYGLVTPRLTEQEQEIVSYGLGDGTIVREA